MSEHYEECENCSKSILESFEMKRWYHEEFCLECNLDLNKECMVCDKDIDEEETFCSRYCYEEFTADY
tara:strand:- start:545 stop:748 length:204 start_codon:yes stop_codon:yes gene_type:complete